MAKDRTRNFEKECEEQMFDCPCCKKQVTASHMACEFGGRGGRAGTGKAKQRSTDHYKKIGAMGGKAKRRANTK